MAAEGEASAGPRAGALLLSKNSGAGFPCPDLYCVRAFLSYNSERVSAIKIRMSLVKRSGYTNKSVVSDTCIRGARAVERELLR